MNKQLSNESIDSLRKRYVNVLQMIDDRGFELITGTYDPDRIDINLFKKMCVIENKEIERSKLDLLATNKDGEYVYIFFSNDKSLGIAALYRYFHRMNNRECKHGIIIYKEKVTYASMMAIEHIAPQMKIELFEEEYFNVCVVKHELVPEHKTLSPEEKVEFLKKYPLPYKNLPRILTSDPVARYYGLEKGQIVRIKRASLLGGVTLYYRICY